MLYVAGSDTGAYYAELSGGTRNQNELWWNTSGLMDVNTFESAMQSKSSIRRVEFGENGSWLVLFRGGGSSWSAGLPTKLYNKLKSRNPRLPPASEVTLGPNETWFVRWVDAKTEWSLPSHISQMCNNVLADGGEVTRVSLFSNDNYLIRSKVPVRSTMRVRSVPYSVQAPTYDLGYAGYGGYGNHPDGGGYDSSSSSSS